jgi:hypothetical protein
MSAGCCAATLAPASSNVEANMSAERFMVHDPSGVVIVPVRHPALSAGVEIRLIAARIPFWSATHIPKTRSFAAGRIGEAII